MPHANRFIVLTGGPGSGKSTLAAALAADGVRCMPEAGRAIIKEQVAIGGMALPWADRALFAELMLAADIGAYREAESHAGGVVVFDRGIPDAVGYLTLCGLPVPPHVARAARTFRYANEVFVAPPWEAIFVGDAERKQSFAEAEATHCAMVAVYSALGYEVVSLPLAPVADRVQFVRDRIG